MTRCTTTIRTAATTLAAMALLAACSGSSATTDLSLVDPATTTTTAPPTTLELTTTTAATTTTSTTSPPTTSPPTTEPEDVEAQIRADFARLIQLRLECGQMPETCQFEEIAVPGSEADEFLRSQMEQRTADGLRSRPGFGEFEYWIESIEVDEQGAIVGSCHVDSVVLFDLSGSVEIVFDDSVVSARTDWQLGFSNGTWKWVTSHVLASSAGSSVCDA